MADVGLEDEADVAGQEEGEAVAGDGEVARSSALPARS